MHTRTARSAAHQTLWRPVRCREVDRRRAGLFSLPQGTGRPTLNHSTRSASTSAPMTTPSSTACVAFVGVACCTCAHGCSHPAFRPFGNSCRSRLRPASAMRQRKQPVKAPEAQHVEPAHIRGCMQCMLNHTGGLLTPDKAAPGAGRSLAGPCWWAARAGCSSSWLGPPRPPLHSTAHAHAVNPQRSILTWRSPACSTVHE